MYDAKCHPQVAASHVVHSDRAQNLLIMPERFNLLSLVRYVESVAFQPEVALIQPSDYQAYSLYMINNTMTTQNNLVYTHTRVLKTYVPQRPSASILKPSA